MIRRAGISHPRVFSSLFFPLTLWSGSLQGHGEVRRRVSGSIWSDSDSSAELLQSVGHKYFTTQVGRFAFYFDSGNQETDFLLPSKQVFFLFLLFHIRVVIASLGNNFINKTFALSMKVLSETTIFKLLLKVLGFRRAPCFFLSHSPCLPDLLWLCVISLWGMPLHAVFTLPLTTSIVFSLCLVTCSIPADGEIFNVVHHIRGFTECSVRTNV